MCGNREAEVAANDAVAAGATNDDGSIDSDVVAEEQNGALAAARSNARSQLESLFVELYPAGTDEEDGLKTSRNERLSKGYQSVTLTYGEVSAIGVRCFSILPRVMYDTDRTD